MKFYIKKATLLFTVIIAFSFVSCEGDGVEVPGNTLESIVGTWAGVDVDYNGETTGTIQGQTISSTFVGVGYDVNYTLTFGENPNSFTTDGSYSIELTTTTLGQTTVQNTENISFLEDGIWEISGDQLTITLNSSGQASPGTIVELTDTMLKLSSTTTQSFSQQGANFTTTVETFTTFTRQ